MTGWPRNGLAVGVDPGLSKGSALVARSLETGKIVHAALVKTPDDVHWLWQAGQLGPFLSTAIDRAGLHGGGQRSLVLLVCELPQVYDRRNNYDPETGAPRKVDPNDLIELGALAGAWCRAAQAEGADARLVRPAVWKRGNTPKKIQAARTRARLTLEEIAVVEAAGPRGRHLDLWDAVGIVLSTSS